MGAVISVCNLKGGAGKSTIAVNLACALQDRIGQECLLVDADRQGTANAWAVKGELPVRVLTKALHEARPEEADLWLPPTDTGPQNPGSQRVAR